MAAKKDKSLEKLRELILGPGHNLNRLQADLDSLKAQFSDKEAMISTLDPVIADLLERKISDNKQDMAETLAPVMSEAIKRQVIETREEVVDALYPVIGKTIRKSVAEAMKDQFNSVNKRIENGIRGSFLPTWLQGKLLGMPRAQLLVKSAMPFRVEQVFLIHTESGLLIAHASPTMLGTAVDQELISGMLTAIRDFVAQAFAEHEHELREIQYGQSKIILDIGRYVYLAVVVSGYEPDHFYEEVGKLNQRIYNRYYQALRQFQGNCSELQSVRGLLQAFIERLNADEEAPDRKPEKPYLFYLLRSVAVMVLLILAILYIPGYLSGYETQRAVTRQLETVPSAGTGQISFKVDGQKVILIGTVNSFAQKAVIDSLIKTVPQVQTVDNRLQVLVPAVAPGVLLTEIQKRLAVYDSLHFYQPRVVIEQDHVMIGGFVPDGRLKREIGMLVGEIAGVRLVTNNLTVLNEGELIEVRGFLRENSVQFAPLNVDFAEKELRKIDAVVTVFRSLKDARVVLVVRGYSDDAQDFYENLQLAKSRAHNVVAELQRRGIPQQSIIVLTYGEREPKLIDETKRSAVNNSRVEFDILLGR